MPKAKMPSKRYRKCCLCKNTLAKTTTTKPHVSYHSFPSNATTRTAWFEVCEYTEGVDNVSSLAICSEHFMPNCYYPGKENQNKVRRLKPGSVPFNRKHPPILVKVEVDVATVAPNMKESTSAAAAEQGLVLKIKKELNTDENVEAIVAATSLPSSSTQDVALASTSGEIGINRGQSVTDFDGEDIQDFVLPEEIIDSTLRAKRKRDINDLKESDFVTRKQRKENLAFVHSTVRELRTGLRVAEQQNIRLKLQVTSLKELVNNSQEKVGRKKSVRKNLPVKLVATTSKDISSGEEELG